MSGMLMMLWQPGLVRRKPYLTGFLAVRMLVEAPPCLVFGFPERPKFPQMLPSCIIKSIDVVVPMQVVA